MALKLRIDQTQARYFPFTTKYRPSSILGLGHFPKIVLEIRFTFLFRIAGLMMLNSSQLQAQTKFNLQAEMDVLGQ